MNIDRTLHRRADARLDRPGPAVGLGQQGTSEAFIQIGLGIWQEATLVGFKARSLDQGQFKLKARGPGGLHEGGRDVLEVLDVLQAMAGLRGCTRQGTGIGLIIPGQAENRQAGCPVAPLRVAGR